MKPGKHQRSKQRCQDLCWKVHDPAQSLVLRSYTMHELRDQHVSIGTELKTIAFCAGSRPKKQNNNIQQRTLTSFITIPLY